LPVKIAYLSADFGVPIFGYKGASVHVREMVTALSQAGHAVTIISPAIEHPLPIPNVDFFPVPLADEDLQRLNQLKEVEALLNMQTRIRQELRNLIYNLRLHANARDYLRRKQVDFVYERYALFGYAGIRLAKELGAPHLLEVNAPLAYEQERTRGLEMKDLARAMERRIFRDSDHVLVVSQHLQEFVASGGVPKNRIEILPNGVDPLRFTPLSADGKRVRAQLGLEGKRVIGFVGSLKPWHGTETLLAAFRELHPAAPQAHLLIVGDGPGREQLEKTVQANGLKQVVTFTGNVPYDEVPHYLAAMDIAVAPYTPNEQFYYSPIKIFEYMAMAKPVVAGRIGQVEEVLRDGETGLLFDPGNLPQLTAALLELVHDASRCRRIGEQARAWVVRERTWDNNARKVVEIASELTKKRKAG
jgi:glycosyltransferase involved in cell wall biosynthesis